jgi:hydrogenase nickel incorporation protein HypA/HybF
MHETAIAQDIIVIVNQSLKAQPEARLGVVRVSIGKMIAVVPELLRHAYNSIVFETPLQDSTLEIDIISITAQCQQCHQKFGLDEYEFLCPHCQSPDIHIKTGNEFYIKELEVE